MKIIEESVSDICVYELQIGQLAVVTSWGVCHNHVGKVVQRYGKDLIEVGGVECWLELFANKPLKDEGKSFRVRVLPPGTRLEV